jgi:bridging integrator 3
MSVSNWFKATQRRMKETILQTVGAHDKTDDGLFDEKHQSFVAFSRDLAKVHLSLQLWLDSMDLLCASSVGIGESLSAFCAASERGNESPLLDVAQAFHAISTDFNTVMRANMRSTFIDRCLKPIESILAIVPVVNDKMQKRKHLRLDTDFYRSKLASEQSAGKSEDHPAVVKIAYKLTEATKTLDAITSELVSCIDELSCQREFMLGPEMAAMVACMQTFYASYSSNLAQISPMIPQSASTSCLLLASFEAQKSLSSKELISKMQAKTSTFPMQPVFIRPNAQGGSAGGYGYTPLVAGAQSKVDSLISSSAEAMNTPTTNIDASSIGGKQPARNSSPAALSCPRPVAVDRTSVTSSHRVMSAKRPLIKLGTDYTAPSNTSLSPTRGSSGGFDSGVDGGSLPRGGIASVAISRSTSPPDSNATSRPMSMPAGSQSPIPIVSAGVNRSRRPSSVKQRGSVTSLRLTASAAALSGSPKMALGVGETGALDERDDEDEDRWNADTGKLWLCT